jgi:NAD+ synthase (glutamine-hydrolysing)
LGQSIAKRLQCPVLYVNQVGGNDELVFDGQSFAVDAKGMFIRDLKGFTEDIRIVDLNSKQRVSLPDNCEMQDLHDALILGTRDYILKSVGTPKVHVALSGGIDSALTAYIASQAVGAENVFGYGMPSPFSSEGSVEDARQLAANLDISFSLLAIGKAYDTFGEILEPAIGWGMPGKDSEDVTEENVQARIRGTIMMAISNRQGGIVLSTGNKSEISVGYCTMYGDMVGGFAVLSDVFKTKVYELARYINRNSEYIPWNTIEKPPSAELCPEQVDLDSLPPYDVLDAILDEYIEGYKDCRKSVVLGADQEIIDWVVNKVNNNEYKRRQMAPGLKVTRKAFGSGRRIPIAAKL